MIKRSEDMRSEIRSKMRGGEGDVTVLHLLEADEMMEKSRFAGLMTIPPGGSVGEHPHGPDAEIYFVLKGEAEIDDNGTVYTLGAGDAVFTGGGEYHSVKNVGDTPLEILGIIII